MPAPGSFFVPFVPSTPVAEGTPAPAETLIETPIETPTSEKAPDPGPITAAAREDIRIMQAPKKNTAAEYQVS